MRLAPGHVPLNALACSAADAGKTTFIKNLLAPYAQDPNLAVNDAPGTEEALHAFRANPERMCTTVIVNDHSSMTSFHYAVQDTPGACQGPPFFDLAHGLTWAPAAIEVPCSASMGSMCMTAVLWA
jgi:hypothetical protein